MSKAEILLSLALSALLLALVSFALRRLMWASFVDAIIIAVIAVLIAEEAQVADRSSHALFFYAPCTLTAA